MSSRQEEKERRRREREDREAAERASAARRKRLQWVFGGVLIVLLIAAGGVFAATQLGGGGNDTKTVAKGGADIPSQQQGDEKKAAAAAGCTLKENVPNEGATHEDKTFTAKDYKQNPPTSGNHFPQWAEDGIYEPGKEPQLGMLVHTLEHGRIDIQYKKGTPAQTISQLETLYKSMDDGHHLLLFQNPTNMPFAVAATDWDNQLGCPTMNDKVFDAIRTFREAHIDQGPEIVP
jgi:hypothetical protein